MTAAVIGIALALPTGLLLMLANAQQVSSGWDRTTQISLFLEPGLDDAAAEGLAEELRARPEVGAVRTISRAQALEEFRRLSGFGGALDALERNPLPAVVVVQPALAHSRPETVAALAEELGALGQVDIAQADMAWVRRLYALMETGRKAVAVVAALLGLAVLLVVGNTIRLDIENRREEIEVTKLIGGTDAFVRRPFLYAGVWYGLAGGVAAWVLVEASLGVLREPVRRLAGLYESGFALRTLGPEEVLALLAAGAALGLAGSWVAVGRHLAAIEPS